MSKELESGSNLHVTNVDFIQIIDDKDDKDSTNPGTSLTYGSTLSVTDMVSQSSVKELEKRLSTISFALDNIEKALLWCHINKVNIEFQPLTVAIRVECFGRWFKIGQGSNLMAALKEALTAKVTRKGIERII